MGNVLTVPRGAALAPLALLSSLCFAEPPTTQPVKGNGTFFLDVRSFGGEERLTYASVGTKLETSERYKVVFRATVADRIHTPLRDGSGRTILHGGTDVEFGLEHRTTDALSTYLGISLPDTPTQRRAAATGRVLYEMRLSEFASAGLSASAVALDQNTIVGVGLGANYMTPSGYSFGGKYTFIVSGDNTRSTLNGIRKKDDLYELGLTYRAPGSPTAYTLGFSNTVGRTTGFGLTPSLGNEGSVFFTVSGRM